MTNGTARGDDRVVTEGEVCLRPTRDARLVPYAVITLGGMAGALVLGEPALAAMAFPFALALALGLRRTGVVPVQLRITLEEGQVLEGDRIHGWLEMSWQGDFAAEILLDRLEGVRPAEEDAGGLASPASLAWSFSRLPPPALPSVPGPPRAADPGRADEDVGPLDTLHAGVRRLRIPFALEAAHWGIHGVGEVWVQLRPRFGLLTWSGRVSPPPTLRVLPGSERLDRLLHLADFRAVWGMHLSRRIGQGNEFAELRPYVPGDRLRDLNWTATARRGRPFVNRYHPDLAGGMVLVLDAFGDDSRVSTEALGRAARAAWAIMSVHLRANDRVGLAGLGRSTEWLPPGGGRLARYRLLQALLRIGGEAASGRAAAPVFRRAAIPPAALVVVLSTLENLETITALREWRARGRTVAVARLDTSDLFTPASASQALAARLWQVELDVRRRRLAEVGIPVVPVRVGEPMAGVIPALRRARRAPAVRRAR